MDKSEPALTSDLLPERLASVFRLLRTGRHLCRDDGPDYHDLARHEAQYQVLLDGLGYELVHHGQGFYYLKGGSTLTSQRLQAVTVFMLILFQDLEDRKFQEEDRAWEKKLLLRRFKVGELPHFATVQRRQMMSAVGVTPETLQQKVLKPLENLGVLESVAPDEFQFRPPAYRFVDLCLSYAREDWRAAAPATGGAETASAHTPQDEADDDEQANGEEA